jgi:hypothetical protein
MRLPYRRDADPDGCRAESSPFADIHDASPCGESWDRMQPVAELDPGGGHDRSRLCRRCGRHLYNLCAMSLPQAERLMRSLERTPPVRLYRRSDGAVLTADCPVGARTKMRHSLVAVAILGGAVIVAGTSLSLENGAHGCEVAMTGAPTPRR